MNEEESGWSHSAISIHHTFMLHNRLLLLLHKLELLTYFETCYLQSDYEQHIWAKIRDGDNTL